jgi:hypothetical protein
VTAEGLICLSKVPHLPLLEGVLAQTRVDLTDMVAANGIPIFFKLLQQIPDLPVLRAFVARGMPIQGVTFNGLSPLTFVDELAPMEGGQRMQLEILRRWLRQQLLLTAAADLQRTLPPAPALAPAP